MLRYGETICTENFAPAVEVDGYVADLSFYYQMYSLDDESQYEALLQIMFPGNNMLFFATVHDEPSCFSHHSQVGFTLEFNNICITKACQHNPCPDSTERYRGLITLKGYKTSSPGTNFEVAKLHCKPPESDVWQTATPWLLTGSGVLLALVVACVCFYRSRRRSSYYDPYYDASTRGNPIPVMMEMVSPLYRNSRRNQRLSTAVFSIPSDIVIPSGTQGMGIATAAEPYGGPEARSDDPALAKMRNPEYEQLTTAEVAREEEEEEEVTNENIPTQA